jgi:hypothetical protein
LISPPNHNGSVDTRQASDLYDMLQFELFDFTGKANDLFHSHTQQGIKPKCHSGCFEFS